MLLQVGRIQFRKPCRIFFAKRLKSFRSKLEYTLTKILWKKIFQEISFWLVKYCLDKPAGNFLAKWPQKICKISKVIQKDEMIRKKISANCSSGQVDCSFDDSAKNFFE